MSEPAPRIIEPKATFDQTSGPMERLLDPFMRATLSKLSLPKYKDKVLEHYDNHRLAYDLGALTLGGIGVGATSALISKALKRNNEDGDDEYEYVVKRRRKDNSGVGNALMWLTPLALLAGGGYVWNKYGDDVTRTVNNAKNFNKDYETWMKIKTKMDKKLTGNRITRWLYNKAKKWVNSDETGAAKNS